MIYCFLEEQVNRTVVTVKLIESYKYGFTHSLRLNHCFQASETLVSSRWNFSSKQEKQKFQTVETKKLYIEQQTDHKEPLKTRQCDSKICRHTAVTYCCHLINRSYSSYYTKQRDRWQQIIVFYFYREASWHVSIS